MVKLNKDQIKPFEKIHQDEGMACKDCGYWRRLRFSERNIRSEIEACSVCGDGAFDIFEDWMIERRR